METVAPQQQGSTSNLLSRNLPDDLVTDILSRLPVKILIRFKSASRPWCALMDKPEFVALHLKKGLAKNSCLLLRHLPDPKTDAESNSQRDEFLFRTGTPSTRQSLNFNYFLKEFLVSEEIYSFCNKKSFEEIGKLRVPLRSKTDFYSIVGSSNGLVCLTESCPEGWCSGLNLSLWNPATKEFRNLSRYYVNRFTGPVLDIGLGFAYHPIINDYRVVRIVNFRNQTSEVEVFSLTTDNWKKIETDVNIWFLFHDQVSQAFVNNTSHWTVRKRVSEDIDEIGLQYFILSFDIGEYKFNVLELPPFNYFRSKFLLQRSPVNESLAVLLCNQEGNIDMWTMDKYGDAESWTKYYTLRPGLRNMVPLSFIDDDQIILTKEDLELVSYNPILQEMKHLHVSYPARIVKYVESLVSPYGRTRAPRDLNWYVSDLPPLD